MGIVNGDDALQGLGRREEAPLHVQILFVLRPGKGVAVQQVDEARVPLADALFRQGDSLGEQVGRLAYGV
jgi:hypothetical protein